MSRKGHGAVAFRRWIWPACMTYSSRAAKQWGPRIGSQLSASQMGGICIVGQVLETGGCASPSWCHPSASWSFLSLGKTGALPWGCGGE